MVVSVSIRLDQVLLHHFSTRGKKCYTTFQLFHYTKFQIFRYYNLKSIAKITLFSDFTKSGLQSGAKVDVVIPVCDVTPPLPAKYGTLEFR